MSHGSRAKPKRSRQYRLEVWLTTEERAALENLASDDYVNVATKVRQLIMRAADERKARR